MVETLRVTTADGHTPSSEQAPKEEVYPRTVVAILERLSSTPPTEMAAELERAQQELLRIFNTGVANFREIAHQRNQPWAGRVVGASSMNEQDGVQWYESETLDVHDCFLTYNLNGSTFNGRREKSEQVELTGTPGGSHVSSTKHIITIKGRNGQTSASSVEAIFDPEAGSFRLNVVKSPDPDKPAGDPTRVEYSFQLTR